MRAVDQSGPTYVVGIGASAGGLRALEELLSNLEAGSECAFLVAQHLAPDHRSMMVELLGRRCRLEVTTAEDGAQLESDVIYVLPPGFSLTVEAGALRMTERTLLPGSHRPIDELFESIAAEYGVAAVGIVLTGTGTDGARGVGAIRDGGGVAMCQDPTTADFDGMPLAAIATGAVAFSGTPAQLAAALDRLGHRVLDPSAEGPLRDLRSIVELLARESGIDFARYKPGTLERRIERRRRLVGGPGLPDYHEMLSRSAEERSLLLRDVLIGVTGFVRDPEVWDVVNERILVPALSDPTRAEFRAWVAGCSTGEEAYTLAIGVREALDLLPGPKPSVKIFATDVDQAALARAAAGRYPRHALEQLGEERIRRFFVPDGNDYVVTPELRRLVLFTHHDLTRNPPFARLDLVTCRNVLIYMDIGLQLQVLTSLRFGLRPGGWLVLGPSEQPLDSGLFTPAHADHRIYHAAGDRPRPSWNQPLSEYVSTGSPHPSLFDDIDHESDVLRAVRRGAALLMEEFTPPAVLVDASFRVRHVYGRADAYLSIPVGAPDLDIREMTTPEMSAAIAPALPRVLASGEAWTFRLRGDEERDNVTVRIVPVPSQHDNGPGAVLVCFDSHEYELSVAERVVDVDLDSARHLAELSAELVRSQASRQDLIEELQAANEELQATNEELQATNEELQATNEELHATNDELHAANTQLEHQVLLLQQIQADLDNLMAATDIGTIFLDQDLCIRRFTPSVTEFLPVRPGDVGRPILELAVGFDPQFLIDLDIVRRGGEARERSLETPHGPVLVRMLSYSVRDLVGVVVTFVDVTSVKHSYELALRVLDALPAQVAFVGFDGTIRMVNDAWDRVIQETGADPLRTGVGANYFDACENDEQGRAAAANIRRVISGEIQEFTWEYPCFCPDERWFSLRVTGPSIGGAVVAHIDITEQKLAERALRELAVRDPLTKTMNRRGVELSLMESHKRSEESGVPVSAVMLDCDDFKRINDRLGHSGGDQVLATVASRAQSVLRPSDVLARVGGDEFLVLLPGAGGPESAVIAERIRLAVGAQPVAVAHGDVGLTVSAAAIELPGHALSLEQLLERCRYALRLSKSNGKNQVSLGTSQGATPLRHDHSGDRAALLAGDDDFGVSAQAIVELTTATIVGYELLTRVTAPPFTPPLTLFRAAMEEGVLAALDERCIRRAIQHGRSLPGDGALHVNMYPSTLLQQAPERLAELFDGSARRRICVELSEQQILTDPESLVAQRAALRAAGVWLAVDDVGFGRTSLETLLVLEPEIIKIDAAYVNGIADRPDRRNWLGRLVAVASSLGASVIAEGIETAADARAIESMGIPHGQGYFFGRPVPVSAVVTGSLLCARRWVQTAPTGG